MDGLNLGLGGAVVVLVIKQLFDYLKTKESGRSEIQEIEKAIYKLTVNMELQTKILQRLVDKLG